MPASRTRNGCRYSPYNHSIDGHEVEDVIAADESQLSTSRAPQVRLPGTFSTNIMCAACTLVGITSEVLPQDVSRPFTKQQLSKQVKEVFAARGKHWTQHSFRSFDGALKGATSYGYINYDERTNTYRVAPEAARVMHCALQQVSMCPNEDREKRLHKLLRESAGLPAIGTMGLKNVRCLATTTTLQARRMCNTKRDVAVAISSPEPAPAPLLVHAETSQSFSTPSRQVRDPAASYPTPESHPRPGPVRAQNSGLFSPPPSPPPRSSAHSPAPPQQASPLRDYATKAAEMATQTMGAVTRLWRRTRYDPEPMDIDRDQPTEVDSDDDFSPPSTPVRRTFSLPPGPLRPVAVPCSECPNLRTRLHACNATLAEQSRALEERTRAAEERDRDSAKQARVVAEQENALGQLRKERDEIRMELECVEDELERLRQTYNASASHSKQLKAQIKNLKADKEDLSQELVELQARIGQHESP